MNKSLKLVEIKFSKLISPAYLRLLKKENTNGPIHRQVIPSLNELVVVKEELADPIGDKTFSPLKGVVHRYPDRILIWPTNNCALHCRFCFRKSLVGDNWALTSSETEKIISYIKKHKEIEEIIFSGGDPFMLNDKELLVWLMKINKIKHLKRIRFHTRMFSALPSRFSKIFFKKIIMNKPVNIVVHLNHPAEITHEFLKVVNQAQQTGINLFSQTVLLKGVNNRVEILHELFSRLLDAGVKPYYLHQADLVPGTKHLRVPLKQGIKLVKELRSKISGLAMPQYVMEIPVGPGKVPVDLGMCNL